MDEHPIEDEERDALSSLANTSPNVKNIHSQSQHIRLSSKRTQRRKHSLDDDRATKNIIDQFLDSSTTTDGKNDNFCPYPSSSDASGYNSSPSKHCGVGDPQPLPEFIGSGGVGSFKAPTRAAVHPTRPPCVELRPHPLKETQVGKFLRNIACTERQLWAGQENGVRFWNLDRVYDIGWGLGGRVRRGDEDAAPFHESVTTSPTMCLIVDDANELVWTGHKDGRIRSWKMDQPLDDNPFKEGLSWQAHRGPVLALVITAYGDIWSGSEGGIIKIWPWETIEKSLSLSPEEKHMAALLVERSGIDLKSQVTVNGNCSISSAEVKCLLSDNDRRKVWAVTAISFSLWNARTKELVKVFNIEGQIENRFENGANPEQSVEDEMKVKFVSAAKKEKPQGILQRSRNAIMGAADAVRRVATKGAGAFQEEAKKTEAIVLAANGMIWTGCSNGLLVQWDGNGNRLHDFNYLSCAVLCFCTLGTRIYVGYVSGFMQVLDLDGNVVAGWVAHTSPVINIAVGGGDCIYSLATHGGIRAWFVASPGPIDSTIRSELASKEVVYTRRDNIKILVGTWNVGQGKPHQEALAIWLGSASTDVGIVVVGCQEVEMGAGFLAMSAAKETVGMEGSGIGNAWLDTIGKTLDEGNNFERMGSRQLAGLLIGLWVRKNLRTHVGDVDVAAVPCGFGRAIGNKGGVGLRIRVHDRIMCFVNCHLAAHLEAVNRRNADFDHIYRTMAFSRSYNVLNAAAAGVSASAQMPRSSSNGGKDKERDKDKDKDKDKYKDKEKDKDKDGQHVEGRPNLSEADMVVFLGDFNYRLFGITYDEARDFVSQRCFDWLRERDQLRAEMKAGKVFQGMREALIRFPPTYKFEPHKPGLAGYDSGEKKRIPAWCDRVLYRDTRSSSAESECSLRCPVVTSILMYEACMEVTESDHKPVRCKYNVDIAYVDRSVRREEFGKIVKSNESIKSMLAELHKVPEIALNTDYIFLEKQEASIVRITNKSVSDKVVFKFISEGLATVKEDGEASDHRARGSFGFPRWLEVTPASGIIHPEQSLDISVQHEVEESGDGIPHNWWSEDTHDKEVILRLIIQGSCTTKKQGHRIRVRHSVTAKMTEPRGS